MGQVPKTGPTRQGSSQEVIYKSPARMAQCRVQRSIIECAVSIINKDGVMKRQLVITIVGCLLVTVTLFMVLPQQSVRAHSSGPTGLDLEYTVGIEKGDDSAHVELSISGLRLGNLVLELKPEAQQGAEKYFSNISASSDGKALVIHSIEEGQWRVHSVQDRVKIKYDVAKIIPFALEHPFAQGNEVAVYIDDEVGYIMAPFFFIYPDPVTFNIRSIRLWFDVPQDWQVVTPYLEEGDHLIVQPVGDLLLSDFINRQQIYMGKMRFYVEKMVGECTIKFGVPEGDESWCTKNFLATEADVKAFVDATAASLEALTEIFGQNPYKTYAMYTNFTKRAGDRQYRYPGTRYFGNGYQYWPEHRWDELVSHMMLSFMDGQWTRPPLEVDHAIEKGIGESYLGHTLARELFEDPSYLAKIYYYYLLYERMLTSNRTEWTEFQEREFQGYVKGEFVGLLLDKEIQKVTNGGKNLADVLRYLYSTYNNTGHVVSYADLQAAIESCTGANLSNMFSQYVYGDEKLPVYEYIEDYRQYFLNYHEVVGSSVWGDLPLYGHTTPFFILIEMAVPLSSHIPAGIYDRRYLDDFASHMLAHYEIDTITEGDVEDALTTLTGSDAAGFFSHWEGSYGRVSLDDLKDWLKDYQKHAAPREIPKINSVSPTEKATDAAVDTSISVTFSRPMDKASTEEAFSISPSAKGKFSWSNNSLVFNPTEDLKYTTTYKITISTKAKDNVGNKISSSYSWSFTTETKPTPPAESKPMSAWVWAIVGIVAAALFSYLLMVRKRGH